MIILIGIKYRNHAITTFFINKNYFFLVYFIDCFIQSISNNVKAMVN